MSECIGPPPSRYEACGGGRQRRLIQIHVEFIRPLRADQGQFQRGAVGIGPGGRPSRSNAKRFTPGGPCSINFGTGSAQSGVGPSTNTLTSPLPGATTSTSTPFLPSRFTSRMVSGLGSPGSWLVSARYRALRTALILRAGHAAKQRWRVELRC